LKDKGTSDAADKNKVNNECPLEEGEVDKKEEEKGKNSDSSGYFSSKDET
jgi:hypothetical protein